MLSESDMNNCKIVWPAQQQIIHCNSDPKFSKLEIDEHDSVKIVGHVTDHEYKNSNIWLKPILQWDIYELSFNVGLCLWGNSVGKWKGLFLLVWNFQLNIPLP
jgi:hypothetical protein